MGPAAIAVGALIVVGAGALVVDSIIEPDSPGTVSNDDPGRSQRLVQQSIDAAFAEVGQDPGDTSYDVAEANRMSTLQDLQPAEPALPGGLAGRVG